MVFNCYGAFRRCEIPVIGVVKGRALGFGCAIAAVCDITLAADTAKFQVPEMAHNIMPTMVMSALVDRVPRKAMTYLVWSTALVSALRAREAGIVSEVFPAAELDAAVDALCAQIMRAPRPARVGCKDYARAALDMDVTGAIEYARSIHAVINSSGEMMPGATKAVDDAAMTGATASPPPLRGRGQARIQCAQLPPPQPSPASGRGSAPTRGAAIDPTRWTRSAILARTNPTGECAVIHAGGDVSFAGEGGCGLTPGPAPPFRHERTQLGRFANEFNAGEGGYGLRLTRSAILAEQTQRAIRQ